MHLVTVQTGRSKFDHTAHGSAFPVEHLMSPGDGSVDSADVAVWSEEVGRVTSVCCFGEQDEESSSESLRLAFKCRSNTSWISRRQTLANKGKATLRLKQKNLQTKAACSVNFQSFGCRGIVE